MANLSKAKLTCFFVFAASLTDAVKMPSETCISTWLAEAGLAELPPLSSPNPPYHPQGGLIGVYIYIYVRRALTSSAQSGDFRWEV